MIFDTRTELCDATALNTGGAATYLIGSQIDLGETAKYLGYGQPIYLHIITQTEIITAGNAGTVTFKLASDDSASISTTTSTVHLTTASHVTDGTDANAAACKAGGVLYSGPIPAGAYERYLGILQVTGTTAISAGAIDAFLSVDPFPKWIATPDGI